MNKARPYIISILISLGTGILSALLTRQNMNLYEEIATPAISPPAILFPIVWTILYLLMGISSALIYNSTATPEARTKALFTYGLSLIVNFFWSIIFFNMRSFLFAFIWLVLLWILVFKTIIEYKPTSKAAAYLQIPYLLWVTFAGYLNLSIYFLNR